MVALGCPLRTVGAAGTPFLQQSQQELKNSMDLFEEAMMSEKAADLHGRSATEKEDSGNSATVDLRHFAFYGFAGRTGTIRWTRKNENIQVQPSDATQMIPQYNYKLDVQALNSRHPGEFECREFRESILGVMPHHWDRREDTYLQLAHFRRHKRKTLKKTPGKANADPFHVPVENNPPGKDSSNKIASMIGKAANIAGSARTKKLHLPEGGLHSDINGDGVLDNVQVVGGHGAEQTVVSVETLLGSCHFWCTCTRKAFQCFHLPLCPFQLIPAWGFC